MGEVFYARDPGCFKITQPAAVHGPKGGSSQILIAMRHGHLDYVDFMLTHGADINAGGPEHSPVRAAVQHTVDDGKGLSILLPASLNSKIDKPH